MTQEEAIQILLGLGFKQYDIQAAAARAGKMEIRHEPDSQITDPSPHYQRPVAHESDEFRFVTVGLQEGVGKTYAFVGDVCYLKNEIVDLEPHGFSNPFKIATIN